MSVTNDLLSDDDRRLQVQGLGFRLVSAFLTHNVSRVAISDLFDSFSEEHIGKTVDSLIDTTQLLFAGGNARPPGFLLFPKFAKFKQDVIPAYPLLGLIVAAAKHVAYNEAAGHGVTLTQNDTLNLRSLTEQLFREALCTQKWAGSGDSKLRSWLDDHFSAPSELNGRGNVPYPGHLINAASTYDLTEWETYLNSLEPTNHPHADKNSTFFAFWIQYLYDARVPGCLPLGAVEFDHIVPFQDTPRSMSTHPLNLAAVSERLNAQKKKRTFNSWAPQGVDAAAYQLQALDGVSVTVNGVAAPGTSYLQGATHSALPRVIAERRAIVEFALRSLLPDWISNGDG